MRKILMSFLLTVVILTTLAGLVQAKEERYIFVSCMGNLEYFIDHKEGWKIAGEIMGVETSYMGPPDYDVNKMITNFHQAIAQRPAGIVVFGVEPILKPVINQAVDSGIPVVTVIGDVPDSKRLSFVGTHQYNAGYVGGKNLVTILDKNKTNKVAVLSLPGVQMFDEREQGYRDAFAESDVKVEVVAVGDTKADTVRSSEVARSIVQSHPDLDAFVCTDSTGAIGAATALKELNKVGQIKIIGMDRNRDILQLIKSGVITASVAQKDMIMSLYALQILYNHNHFPGIPITDNNEKAGVNVAPARVNTGLVWVDESNVEYFLRDEGTIKNYLESLKQ